MKEVFIGDLKKDDVFCFKRDLRKRIASKIYKKRGYITYYERLGENRKCFQYYISVFYLRSIKK